MPRPDAGTMTARLVSASTSMLATIPEPERVRSTSSAQESPQSPVRLASYATAAGGGGIAGMATGREAQANMRRHGTSARAKAG